MSYEAVAEKLRVLPESQLTEVSDFIDYIQDRNLHAATVAEIRRRAILSSLTGIIPSTITDEEVKNIRMYK